MLQRSRWKRYATVILGTATLVSACAAVVLKILARVPTYYRSADSLSAEERTTEARQFVRQSTAVFNQIENEPSWSGVFRERQVNAWLAGDFARKHSQILPAGVSEPRVSFDDGRLTLGFQMENGPIVAVISASGRVWLPEPNFVAVELETVHAGSLPIPARAVVETVGAAAKSAGFQIEWREHAGRPVALVRLSSPDKQAAVQVERIELREGLLYVSGRSSHRAANQNADSLSGAALDVTVKRQSPEATLQR